jgi:adenylate kinase family enzyme
MRVPEQRRQNCPPPGTGKGSAAQNLKATKTLPQTDSGRRSSALNTDGAPLNRLLVLLIVAPGFTSRNADERLPQRRFTAGRIIEGGAIRGGPIPVRCICFRIRNYKRCGVHHGFRDGIAVSWEKSMGKINGKNQMRRITIRHFRRPPVLVHA